MADREKRRERTPGRGSRAASPVSAPERALSNLRERQRAFERELRKVQARKVAVEKRQLREQRRVQRKALAAARRAEKAAAKELRSRAKDSPDVAARIEELARQRQREREQVEAVGRRMRDRQRQLSRLKPGESPGAPVDVFAGFEENPSVATVADELARIREQSEERMRETERERLNSERLAAELERMRVQVEELDKRLEEQQRREARRSGAGEQQQRGLRARLRRGAAGEEGEAQAAARAAAVAARRSAQAEQARVRAEAKQAARLKRRLEQERKEQERKEQREQAQQQRAARRGGRTQDRELSAAERKAAAAERRAKAEERRAAAQDRRRSRRDTRGSGRDADPGPGLLSRLAGTGARRGGKSGEQPAGPEQSVTEKSVTEKSVAERSARPLGDLPPSVDAVGTPVFDPVPDVPQGGPADVAADPLELLDKKQAKALRDRERAAARAERKAAERLEREQKQRQRAQQRREARGKSRPEDEARRRKAAKEKAAKEKAAKGRGNRLRRTRGGGGLDSPRAAARQARRDERRAKAEARRQEFLDRRQALRDEAAARKQERLDARGPGLLSRLRERAARPAEEQQPRPVAPDVPSPPVDADVPVQRSGEDASDRARDAASSLDAPAAAVPPAASFPSGQAGEGASSQSQGAVTAAVSEVPNAAAAAATSPSQGPLLASSETVDTTGQSPPPAAPSLVQRVFRRGSQEGDRGARRAAREQEARRRSEARRREKAEAAAELELRREAQRQRKEEQRQLREEERQARSESKRSAKDERRRKLEEARSLSQEFAEQSRQRRGLFARRMRQLVYTSPDAASVPADGAGEGAPGQGSVVEVQAVMAAAAAGSPSGVDVPAAPRSAVSDAMSTIVQQWLQQAPEGAMGDASPDAESLPPEEPGTGPSAVAAPASVLLLPSLAAREMAVLRDELAEAEIRVRQTLADAEMARLLAAEARQEADELREGVRRDPDLAERQRIAQSLLHRAGLDERLVDLVATIPKALLAQLSDEELASAVVTLLQGQAIDASGEVVAAPAQTRQMAEDLMRLDARIRPLTAPLVSYASVAERAAAAAVAAVQDAEWEESTAPRRRFRLWSSPTAEARARARHRRRREQAELKARRKKAREQLKLAEATQKRGRSERKKSRRELSRRAKSGKDAGSGLGGIGGLGSLGAASPEKSQRKAIRRADKVAARQVRAETEREQEALRAHRDALKDLAAARSREERAAAKAQVRAAKLRARAEQAQAKAEAGKRRQAEADPGESAMSRLASRVATRRAVRQHSTASRQADKAASREADRLQKMAEREAKRELREQEKALENRFGSETRTLKERRREAVRVDRDNRRLEAFQERERRKRERRDARTDARSRKADRKRRAEEDFDAKVAQARDRAIDREAKSIGRKARDIGMIDVTARPVPLSMGPSYDWKVESGALGTGAGSASLDHVLYDLPEPLPSR